MSQKPRIAIVGASGYSGELLVKLLVRHPRVELAAVTSRRHAGSPLAEVLPSLRGVAGDLAFTASEPSEVAARSDVDLVFLALPHGVAAEYAVPLVAAGKRVIDLSADFRLGSAETYAEFYGQKHPAPDLLPKTRYVIPELHPVADWRDAPLIASPGCYPTSAIVPLYPLLNAGVVSPEGIVINAMSGVSGAGKKATEFYSYCERAESAIGYGMPKHRHLSEMEEQLSTAAGTKLVLQFNPHLVPMRRGILTTITAGASSTLDALYAAWNDRYADQPFVDVLPSGNFPDTAHVVDSNRVAVSAVHDSRTGAFIITSAEDNLMKGASGQAIQIMNLWLGFDQTTGLL